ncbi:General transcription factor II-I repeat domain-containing protein 2B [Thelohanellus kitauei]|uniref:General transcription factor II-I repeat domain-containing protein 2B n=1 Tax=Thelohanellus kitauei TaxID=669202 RepID=A0A0C2IX42_THEKT|nr:General transcription factor II-I repeat domain-containing protein 2B [Thelohanellus kitauei]
MVGSKSGCLTLLKQFLGRPILKYHCILCHESLCGKTSNLKNVMDVVVRCVNKICKSALNRLEYRQFLSDMNEEYGERRLHCEVKYFSKGKVLSRFWALKNSIYLFLSETDELLTEREYILNDDWLNDLAFMVGITSQLHCLNERLQVKDKLFTNLCDEVYAFQMKLRLFIRQLTEGILDAFPTLKAHLLEKIFNVFKYQMTLESLLEAFECRLDEFEKEKNNVALFTNPFCFLNQRFIIYMDSFN